MKKKDTGSIPEWQSVKLIPAIGTGKKIVEIGSYRGVTARKLALNGNEVICIDPFIGGYSDDGASQELLGENDIREDFIKNTEGLNVRLIEKYSYDAIKDFDEEIDVLIIDGNHDYEPVKQDCEWVKFVRAGGLIFFHDCGGDLDGVGRAVKEVISPKYKEAIKIGSLVGFEK